MAEIFSILLGYLIGSIPFSYLVAKIKGFDLKTLDKNGRIGASAVKRCCGLKAAILAGVGDFGKGSLAVFIAKKIAPQEWVIILSALAAVIGHNWSIYLNFWGGKGALVSFGALLVLMPLPFLISLWVLLPYFLLKRKTVLGMRETSFFTGLGYLSVFGISYFMERSFPLALSPVILSLPMIFKKNY